MDTIRDNLKQRVNIHRNSLKRCSIFLVTALCLVALPSVLPLNVVDLGRSPSHRHARRDDAGPVCPQVGELVPSVHTEIWKSLVEDQYQSPEFKTRAIEWLGGAVRVRTETFDNMGPVEVDPRWRIFNDFHKYLLDSFPLAHATLKLTKVNTYGLLYHWEGTNRTLKPLFLTAHQDVVPVDPNTENTWNYPPFSGHFDGEKIWGRGSSDDKGSLIAIMSSIETLLQRGGFSPSRSIVLAFGFDEEAGGTNGAQELSKEVIRQFGEDSMAMLIDEGGGFGSQYGAVIASPGVAEKGALNARIEVSAPGGHSSIPPAHTSIGMLASVLVSFEDHPFEGHLARGTPMYDSLLCLADYGPEMPGDLRKALKESVTSDEALRQVEDMIFRDPGTRSFVGTTQAIDLISGGVKANALPEEAYAIVNHRISTQSNVDSVKARDTTLMQPFAEKFNLSFEAFGKIIRPHTNSSRGSFNISDAYGTALEPAPVTPTHQAAPFDLLSGTIKATYNVHRSHKPAQEIHVAPGTLGANTDTRYYWKTTKHIFRYGHADFASASGIHTVNEYFSADGLLEQIKFFTTLILNADESRNI